MNTTISEALATGLPVVATRHSGFPDQVKDEVNGYLANEADPEDLASKMLEYMEHPERWGDMSKAARAHALANYDREALIGHQLEHYKRLAPGAKKVAFIVGRFPVVSETFIINQVADLIDRGLDVHIFTFRRGDIANVSDRYHSYEMAKRTTVLEMPNNWFLRFVHAIPKFLHVLRLRPSALPRVFNVAKYGANTYSLKNLFWTEPFIGLDADIVHCHFGPMGVRYLMVRDVLLLAQPFVTTLYGFDVSQIVKQKGPRYYARLIKESAYFFTMSNNMKERMVAMGFPKDKVEVLPVSVDVLGFPYRERKIVNGETMRIISVGRFVEKKGFDDLLRATAILKKKAPRPFMLHIIGGGMLENELKALTKELDILDVVRFEGFMKIQDVVRFYTTAHLFVQASKTAKNGDME
ncbi:MAG: hypothetical protein A3D65_04875 [Candidatus Lloydbacteria bacterium RIFCSPHIGHO2_02_FULL_50_13]|uniref:Glycosyl transferase family 1 domain-containing protein n=1 Tax=Candidatus Lloydbacteria bacterium RIFCSPHIGHO2_02_FULL_50_13 TaxID=1798661 RepID=A0A1G2D4P3_9BACT|nr:MAG: hypothetical protein A3D65_04875 [Candidatus Lloydbacteria bacterium RIFCSPHIGHO2_02_FULL_50_13]